MFGDKLTEWFVCACVCVCVWRGGGGYTLQSNLT